jgi:hypothetical protein
MADGCEKEAIHYVEVDLVIVILIINHGWTQRKSIRWPGIYRNNSGVLHLHVGPYAIIIKRCDRKSV